MPRFFTENISDEQIVLTGEDAHHVSKVLRMKTGDELTVSDGKKYDYTCLIEAFSKDEVYLKIINKEENKTEPQVKIRLYQCLPKGDKFDFIVQKAVELGAVEIIPVISRFCVAKANKNDFEKKLVRYNKIAKEAAKQSQRGIIPTVSNIISFECAIKQVNGSESIIFYEGGGERVSQILDKDTKEVNAFVGSEGGFSLEEIELAKENGVETATLGKLILRCETAAVAGVTTILCAVNNM